MIGERSRLVVGVRCHTLEGRLLVGCYTERPSENPGSKGALACDAMTASYAPLVRRTGHHRSRLHSYEYQETRHQAADTLKVDQALWCINESGVVAPRRECPRQSLWVTRFREVE